MRTAEKSNKFNGEQLNVPISMYFNGNRLKKRLIGSKHIRYITILLCYSFYSELEDKKCKQEIHYFKFIRKKEGDYSRQRQFHCLIFHFIAQNFLKSERIRYFISNHAAKKIEATEKN